jgi:hypothetical protein
MFYRSILVMILLVSASFSRDVKFKAYLPVLNWLYLDADTNKQSEIGLWLLGLGYEHFLTESVYLSVDAEIVSTAMLLIPKRLSFRKNVLQEKALSLQLCKDFNRLSLAIGPRYGIIGHMTKYASPTYEGWRGVCFSSFLGLKLSGSYQITDHFSLGLNYCPDLHSYGEESFRYAHALYLSLILKTKKM